MEQRPFASAVPNADERFAGAGRIGGLFAPSAGRKNHALCSPARGNAAGSAAVIRHGYGSPRRRDRAVGEKPRRPSDESRRKSTVIPPVWERPMSSRRRQCWASTIPIARKRLRDLGQPQSWDAARLSIRKTLEDIRKNNGRGLRILTETVSSPTLADQLAGDRAGSVRRAYPEAKWYQYEPTHGDGSSKAADSPWASRLTPSTILPRPM